MQHLEIFKSLFKGREDVFAIRWERDGKSGYTPAYVLNWDEFKLYKAKGGTLKDFPNKTYAPLTNERMLNHLSGKEVLGIYPLLPDNASLFIAADFDQSTSKIKLWLDECLAFIRECENFGLPVYLERSRSGNGGHVWMFFEKPYPAFKSRRLFIHLLNSAGIVSETDKNSNFDRLFPNQDGHSGKGLGNLIALPLQKKALENNNSCFIQKENLRPFPDQWAFLQNVIKIKTSKLDELYNAIVPTTPGENGESTIPVNSTDGKIAIILSNQITLSGIYLSPLLVNFLNDNLNFINPDYFIKKAMGRNTYDTEVSFRAVEEKQDKIIIPRGFIGKLLRYCKAQNIEYQFLDKRTKLEPVKLTSSISLYDYQQETVDITNKKDFGVIVAPPGSGKTIMALAIIARKQQPALIIVHRKQLFNQWIDRIQSFLNIPKFRIGKIEGGRCEIGEEITVAMIQSLLLPDSPHTDKLYRSFGTIIVDECHHVPAKTFHQAIKHFHSYYLYGFTATPARKNKDEQLIFIHIGDIIHEVIIPVTGSAPKQLSVSIQKTELFAPFNSSTDKVETLVNILIHDTARNELIVNDVKRETRAGRKVLVLTERKAHVDILQHYLKGTVEAITLTGEDSEQNKKGKFQLIQSGDFQVLIATGQFLGEGTDIGVLNCLVLAFPFSFEGKLIQYIGRVQRSVLAPVVYDYRDYRIDYFNNLFRQRNKYYRQLMRSGTLAKADELILVFKGHDFYINTTAIFLPIDCLDLPSPVEKFKDDVIWKLRVNRYDEEQGALFAEITDYEFPASEVTNFKNSSFYFYGIETIRFSSLDTTGFLRSVNFKKVPLEEIREIKEIKAPIIEIEKITLQQYVFLKTIKVPFSKISFLNGMVSFPIFIDTFNQDVVFEINNPDIRPEFAAISDYFQKVMKKKYISVDVAVQYTEDQILSSTAKSGDIDSINSEMVDSMKFEFVKREIFKGKKQLTDDKTIQTIDDLLMPYDENKKIFSSVDELIDNLLNVKKTKHYLQVKYLSSKHVASVLKVRFVLQPFSFLFLLAGESKYHIVWETLDTEEATYLWHIDKSREALRAALAEIEVILTEIKLGGRQRFLEKAIPGFSRIVHDYYDAEKGFVTWKSMLEEQMV